MLRTTTPGRLLEQSLVPDAGSSTLLAAGSSASTRSRSGSRALESGPRDRVAITAASTSITASPDTRGRSPTATAERSLRDSISSSVALLAWSERVMVFFCQLPPRGERSPVRSSIGSRPASHADRCRPDVHGIAAQPPSESGGVAVRTAAREARRLVDALTVGRVHVFVIVRVVGGSTLAITCGGRGSLRARARPRARGRARGDQVSISERTWDHPDGAGRTPRDRRSSVLTGRGPYRAGVGPRHLALVARDAAPTGVRSTSLAPSHTAWLAPTATARTRTLGST